MDAKGSFRVSNVFPDRYRLEISPMPDNAFVQSVDMNGSLVHSRLLDLFGGAAGVELKIVVSGDASRITGKVWKKNTDVPVARAEVLLFPVREGMGLDEEECQTATADDSGTYSYHGLAPGRYRLVARPAFASDECKQTAVAIHQGLIAADKVELRPREETVKNVQIVDGGSDESLP
jgi:hypothetical protein